jgi:hypothetical protein
LGENVDPDKRHPDPDKTESLARRARGRSKNR